MFKFRRDAPVLLILSVVVVVSITSFLSNWMFGGMTEEVEQGEYATMEAIADSALRSAEGKALARAEMIAELPTTKAIFATHDDAARQRLVAEYGAMFKVQKEKYGVDQMQFHVPPAVSFLRLHSPDKYGDDLSVFRPMVLAVNQDQVARKGIAIAKGGPAVFGVVPMYDADKKHIGSFEVGIDYGAVLDQVKADFGLEMAVFIAEEPLRKFTDPAVTGEMINEHNRVAKFIKFHSTHWDLLQKLVAARDVSGLDRPVRYAREALGTPYGVVLMPIRNLAGETMGVVAVAKSFQASRAAAGRSVVWQALLALFAIVVLSGVILVVVRGLLTRPLEELRELQRKQEEAAAAAEARQGEGS